MYPKGISKSRCPPPWPTDLPGQENFRTLESAEKFFFKKNLSYSNYKISLSRKMGGASTSLMQYSGILNLDTPIFEKFYYKFFEDWKLRRHILSFS